MLSPIRYMVDVLSIPFNFLDLGSLLQKVFPHDLQYQQFPNPSNDSQNVMCTCIAQELIKMESDSVNTGGASDAGFLASSQRLPKLLITETHCVCFLKDQQAECSSTILHSKPQPCYPPGFFPSILSTKQWCRLEGQTLDTELARLKPLAIGLVCRSSWYATPDCFKHPDIEANQKNTTARIRGAQLSTLGNTVLTLLSQENSVEVA